MFLLQGAGILCPKLFSLGETALLKGSSSRKTFVSVIPLTSSTGTEEVKKSKCPRACLLALLPETLGCRASPAAPAVYRNDPPTTLRLQQDSRPQFNLRTETWQEKVRPILNWALPVLGKWKSVWEVAERMRRALGNNIYQENLEWFGCFNWKRERLNHNLVQIYKISRRDW